GENLSDAQIAAMKQEKQEAETTPSELLNGVKNALNAALQQLRSTPPDQLYETREVGRAKLPSTVIGLLFHAAEHAQRHAGQIATTFRFIRK
ncbi:MAG TPA: DinB family protein, partial [Anaerolineales bacterium]|nr:DinB family protein [Anaerolineales bacterium]